MWKCSGYYPVSKSQFRQKVDIVPLCCRPSLYCIHFLAFSASKKATYVLHLSVRLCLSHLLTYHCVDEPFYWRQVGTATAGSQQQACCVIRCQGGPLSAWPSIRLLHLFVSSNTIQKRKTTRQNIYCKHQNVLPLVSPAVGHWSFPLPGVPPLLNLCVTLIW